MPTIPVTDSLGLKIDLKFDEKSDAARLGLAGLASKTSEFVSAAGKALDATPFQAALFGGTYKAPQLALGKAVALGVKGGANTSIRVFRSSEKNLFETGGAAPEISINPGQAWVSFEIDTTLAVTVATGTPAGFGVSGTHMQAHSVTVYTLIQSESGRFPTLQTAVEKALSEFRIPSNSSDIHNQPVNTVYEWDVSGTFALEGTYAYPLAVNALSLANARLPLGRELVVAPDVELSLAGSLAVTGEFRGRCYRANAGTVQLGLYKKKETDLAASFTAKAGLDAVIGTTDLLAAFFRAIPGANFDIAQLDAGERRAVADSLGSAVDQGLSIALNLSCSAALTDEAAVLYEIDLTRDAAQTGAAIEAALAGNWTPLRGLPGVRELRNVLTRTKETGWKASLNLLGVYDYASIQDFVKQSTILHGLENGTITITDQATAQRLTAASAPFAAQDDKLRKVLEESFLATVAYSAAGRGAPAGPALSAAQSLLVYKARQSYTALKKDLLVGEALGLLSAADLAAIGLQKQFKYFRLTASAVFDGDDALRLFFSDIAARTPRTEEDLKKLGRKVMIALLDPAIATDDARRKVLASDALWAQMEQQKFPANSPASYSDWYDIVTWAHAIAAVAPKLSDVLAAWQTVTGDPAKDTHFMAARDALASALAEVTKNTRAAFEHGWPVAAMYALGGRSAPVTFDAQWDGVKRFDKQSVRVLKA
ncbi:MAG TPA: hypothetical protein VH477_18100 [Bryobacteraceae bacterium]